MGKNVTGKIEAIYEPENRFENKWGFNLKIDGTYYGSFLGTEESLKNTHAEFNVGDTVTLSNIKETTRGEKTYQNFAKIEMSKTREVAHEESKPDDMTDEEFLQHNWDMSFRIARKAIDDNVDEDFLKTLKELNPGAYIEALEKVAVSVSIDMKQRGL